MSSVRTALLAALALVVSPLLVVTSTTPAHAAVNVFPVPTSNANLGRITTAPDGSMWFLERGANKVGRISTSGAIQEFALPPTDSTVDNPAVGLDVGPDGVVWVSTEHGSNIVRMSSSGQVLNNWQFDPDADSCIETCPWAGEIRVAPNGVAWVTMNYNESYIVAITLTGVVTDHPNSPQCDDVLGEAADGRMWCQNGDPSSQDVLTLVNTDASGGVNYPLPSDATYPNALAAGPVGSIWFTRSSSGTMFTSPSRGSVGYLDQATGAAQVWQTGSRSAPQDLVHGPDNQMWFTNAGAVPGIGHINANGVGAISSVGSYEPHSLTFGPDGAIWFTDTKNNAIVRVTTDQLRTTNVDLGDGVTMLAPNAAAGSLPVGKVGKVRGVQKLKGGLLRVPLKCPASASTGCAGKIRIELARGKRPIAKPKGYQAQFGAKATVAFRVYGKELRKIRRGTVVKVRVKLTRNGSKKAVAQRVIKVKRA